MKIKDILTETEGYDIKQAIVDAITVLKAQETPKVSAEELINQLETYPEINGMSLNNDVLTSALTNVEGVSTKLEDGELYIYISQPSTDADRDYEREEKDINNAAMRTIHRDGV